MRYKHKIIKILNTIKNLLFKYIKSKTKIHKNVSTIKNGKTGELTNTTVKTDDVLTRFFFNLFILWKSFIPLKKSFYEEDKKSYMN